MCVGRGSEEVGGVAATAVFKHAVIWLPWHRAANFHSYKEVIISRLW